MPDIDWSILANASPRAADPVSVLALGEQQRQAQQAQALRQQQFAAQQAAAQRAQAAQAQAAGQWKSGDTRGAQATLLGAGANDLLGTLNNTDKQNFDQRTEGVKAIGGFANYVMTHISDPAQRASVIQHNKPLLVAAGAHPEDVDAVAANPSDDILGGVAHQYYTAKDQDTNARENTQTTINQQNADTQRFSADTGRMGEIRQENTPIGISGTDNVYLPGGVAASGTPGHGSTFDRMVGAESSGHQLNAQGQPLTSPKGAVGIAQLLPSTAQDAARMAGVAFDPQRFATDATYNRQLGQTYFNFLLNRYQGDETKAVAAYNGGLGRVDAAVARNGQNWLAVMPNETKAYVAKVQPGQAVRGPTQIARGVPKADATDVPGDANLTGDAYLATIPADIRAQIKAISDGRVAAPNPRSNHGAQLLAMVTQYDPTFDAANATTRAKTRVDFTSGKSAQAKNALNTAMGHLLHLDQQAQDLGNFSFLPGVLNPIYNSARATAGDTKLPAFEQTKQAAASEMRKVFAGSSGGNLAELEGWEKTLSSAQSPEQLHQVIKNGVSLMGSRLNALQDQYANGMGRSDQIPAMLDPRIAAATKKRFDIDLGGGQSPSHQANNRANIPNKAAEFLRANPSLRAQFDQKYGAGAAASVLGR